MMCSLHVIAVQLVLVERKNGILHLVFDIAAEQYAFMRTADLEHKGTVVCNISRVVGDIAVIGIEHGKLQIKKCEGIAPMKRNDIRK